ncbi:MAG: hypothetical protein QS721_01020 [Candidatus Endonucleobacter sp. (ex Gigantidas childressi)]|nr:hypothetical protein [Candidatus Endonucleobacter sp. (ex Gigantidas childressi)]
MPSLVSNGFIPVAFQVATLLAAFAHPDHLLVGSRGFAYLLPSSNLKCFGYISNREKSVLSMPA